MDMIQQLRLLIGDVEEPYLLTEDQLQFYLDSANGDVFLAAMRLRPIMLMQLATTQVREREGSVEVYGGEKAYNYMKALKYLEDSAPTDFKATATPVIGGVRNSDNYLVDNDIDSNGPRFSLGMFS